MTKNNWNNWIWPSVDNIEGAKTASLQGFWAAIISSGITILFAILSLIGIQILDIDIWVLIDVAIFIVIAFGIYKMSRTAAVAGLTLFLLERIFGWLAYGFQGNFIIAIIFIFMFINSVRGTFAYHKLNQ